jgi:hypothetical protein
MHFASLSPDPHRSVDEREHEADSGMNRRPQIGSKAARRATISGRLTPGSPNQNALGVCLTLLVRRQTDLAEDFQHPRSAAAWTCSRPQAMARFAWQNSSGTMRYARRKPARHLEYWSGSIIRPPASKPRWCTAWGRRRFQTAITAFFAFEFQN